MSENYNQIYEEEKVISLSGICFYVLKKWKIMVIVAVIAAIAAGGLGYVKNYQAYKENPTAAVVQGSKEPDVPEEQKEIVRVKMDMIQENRDIIAEYDYYYENSIKVKLDPNNVYQGTANYVFSAENSEELLKAVALYEGELFPEEGYAELGQSLTKPTDVAMVKEVISFEKGFGINSNTNFWLDNQGDMSLKITVRHYNEVDCEKMLAFIEEEMDTFPELLAAENVAAEVTKMSAKVEKCCDRGLTTLGKDIRTARLNAYENISIIKNNMSDVQQTYYNYMISQEESAGTETTGTITVSPKAFINMKLVMIAAFAGAFCVAAFYVMLYLVGGRVHNKEELKSWMNIPVLGFESGAEMAAAHLEGIAGKNEAKCIYLTGSLATLNMGMMMQLKELLAAKGVEAIVGNSILKDAKALQDAGNCGFVVLLEKCNVSKEKDIREEIIKASSCGIKVLSVILEK